MSSHQLLQQLAFDNLPPTLFKAPAALAEDDVRIILYDDDDDDEGVAISNDVSSNCSVSYQFIGYNTSSFRVKVILQHNTI